MLEQEDSTCVSKVQCNPPVLGHHRFMLSHEARLNMTRLHRLRGLMDIYEKDVEPLLKGKTS